MEQIITVGNIVCVIFVTVVCSLLVIVFYKDIS